MEIVNVYGASGHAKVVIDAIKSQPYRKVGKVFDDDPNIKALLEFQVNSSLSIEALMEFPLVIAIGNNRIRKKISSSFKGVLYSFISHNSAVIAPSSSIGDGTVIFANAVVNASTVVGKHCILNTGSVVEHDCGFADFVHISPNAALAGGVQIGEGTHIGTGAVVIPGIKIGDWCIIGAGAVIIEDVPSFATVVGNPGRILKIDPVPNVKEEEVSSSI